MKVAILRPNEELKVEEIENTLECKQKLVGGLIEFVPIDISLTAIINEEGKLNKLEPQLFVFDKKDFLCGTIIFVSEGEYDITDITDEDLERLEVYIKENKLNSLQVKRAKEVLDQYF